MSTTRQRITSGFAIFVAGALLFVVASAFVAARELPGWLAGAVGAFAFPLAPLAWHVVAERRRTAREAAAKQPKRSSLSGIDRLWLRLAAVALAIVGPMVAVDGFDVVRAAWHHGLWFVPSSARLANGDGERMLRYVPGDAELVVVRIADRACPFDVHGDAVAAWGDRQGLVVANSDLTADNVDPVARELNRLRRLPLDKLEPVKLGDGARAIASYGWRAHVEGKAAGPSDDLRAELARAPADASIVAAFVPRTIGNVPVRAAAGWLRADKTNRQVVIEARIIATDDPAAKQIVDAMRTAAVVGTDGAPDKCRATLKDIADHITFDVNGVVVTARLEIAAEQLLALPFCAAK